ncbi:MAG: hypothetical protein WCR31_12440 [Treponema sp.]
MLSVFLMESINKAVEMKPEKNFFYTGNDGAEMPVWVCGNTGSNIFIVYLAGGPGDSCLLEHYSCGGFNTPPLGAYEGVLNPDCNTFRELHTSTLASRLVIPYQ